jgi:flagellar biosynthesis/type III secretory pathway chaperone
MTAIKDLPLRLGFKKMSAEKLQEIKREKEMLLRNMDVTTSQWRSKIAPEANTADQSNQ